MPNGLNYAVTIACDRMRATEGINTVELFRRLAEDGDQEALWAIHKRYYRRLCHFVLPLVHTKEVTEEIVADTFMGIWQKRHLLTAVSNPEVYLFVCAKNRTLKHLKLKALITVSLEDSPECVLERDPSDILISSEMLLRINKAIETLPPRCKLIFILVKENNLKYREVADLLDISEKTVEVQISTALRKLSASIPFSLFS